jgi:hypothetical protein
MMPMLAFRPLAAIANAVVFLLAGVAAAGPNVVLVRASGKALAEPGAGVARFSEAVAGPTVAADQAELLSGRHEFACGVSHEREGRNFVRPDAPLLPEAFRRAGYRTALAGEWRLGSALPCRAVDRGFEETFGTEPDGALDGRWGVAAGSTAELRKREALRWLGERAADRKPFFLAVDWPAGEPLAGLQSELDRLGLEGGTIVVAGGKPSADAGFPENTTAALAIRWPGRTDDGRTVEGLASWLDVAPTLAAACGLEFPAGDGIDLGPVLAGKAELPPGRKFFLHAGGWPGDDSPERHASQGFAVRDARWLLSGLEFSDLTKPAAERANEFERHTGLATAWLRDYGAWWRGVLPAVQEPVRAIVGDARQPVVRLTAADWWPSREVAQAEGAAACRDQAALFGLLETLADPGKAAGQASVSGHWKLQVASEGHYRITLWKLPPEAGEAERKRLGTLRAGTVHLRAGKFELRSAVLENATAVTVGMDLPQGAVEFEAWFDGQLPGERIVGALFVSLERVGERKLPDPESLIRPDAKKP